MRSLVVVPTYEEASNIDAVLRRIREVAPGVDVLVVDDASPDGTADMAEALGAELGAISVLRRGAKQGLGAAYRAGFAWGIDRGYEALVEMDADLSHDPADLPRLLGALVPADDAAPGSLGAELVIGSRYAPGGSIPAWSWHRKALSRWGNRYAAVVLGLSITDATSGFRAYRATTLVGLDPSHFRAKGYAFQIETAYAVAAGGGRIREVPIAFTDRVRGTSKMSGRIIVEAMVRVTAWAIRDRVVRRKRSP